MWSCWDRLELCALGLDDQSTLHLTLPWSWRPQDAWLFFTSQTLHRPPLLHIMCMQQFACPSLHPSKVCAICWTCRIMFCVAKRCDKNISSHRILLTFYSLTSTSQLASRALNVALHLLAVFINECAVQMGGCVGRMAALGQGGVYGGKGLCWWCWCVKCDGLSVWSISLLIILSLVSPITWGTAPVVLRFSHHSKGAIVLEPLTSVLLLEGRQDGVSCVNLPLFTNPPTPNYPLSPHTHTPPQPVRSHVLKNVWG